jgi:hypothetical protein
MQANVWGMQITPDAAEFSIEVLDYIDREKIFHDFFQYGLFGNDHSRNHTTESLFWSGHSQS